MCVASVRVFVRRVGDDLSFVQWTAPLDDVDGILSTTTGAAQTGSSRPAGLTGLSSHAAMNHPVGLGTARERMGSFLKFTPVALPAAATKTGRA